jgi:hypothetical protein
MYTRTACTQGKRKQIKYPPKLVRFTDHSPQVVLDRRRTPHSIYWFSEIVRQASPDEFSLRPRFKRKAITDTDHPTVRV